MGLLELLPLADWNDLYESYETSYGSTSRLSSSFLALDYLNMVAVPKYFLDLELNFGENDISHFWYSNYKILIFYKTHFNHTLVQFFNPDYFVP